MRRPLLGTVAVACMIDMNGAHIKSQKAQHRLLHRCVNAGTCVSSQDLVRMTDTTSESIQWLQKGSYMSGM